MSLAKAKKRLLQDCTNFVNKLLKGQEIGRNLQREVPKVQFAAGVVPGSFVPGDESLGASTPGAGGAYGTTPAAGGLNASTFLSATLDNPPALPSAPAAPAPALLHPTVSIGSDPFAESLDFQQFQQSLGQTSSKAPSLGAPPTPVVAEGGAWFAFGATPPPPPGGGSTPAGGGPVAPSATTSAPIVPPLSLGGIEPIADVARLSAVLAGAGGPLGSKAEQARTGAEDVTTSAKLATVTDTLASIHFEKHVSAAERHEDRSTTRNTGGQVNAQLMLALREYREALRINPADERVRGRIKLLERHLRKRDRGIPLLRFVSHHNLAIRYWDSGKATLAVKECENAIAILSTDPPVFEDFMRTPALYGRRSSCSSHDPPRRRARLLWRV